MAIDREAIFRALFALTANITWPLDYDNPMAGTRTFLSRRRRVALFSDIPIEEQPALCQAEHNETASQITNQPYKWTLPGQWLIYHSDGTDRDFDPTITNNLIMNAVEKAMEPKIGDIGYFDQRNTLQGLVHHCFIDGEVFKDPGDIDNQALLVVPIKILVP